MRTATATTIVLTSLLLCSSALALSSSWSGYYLRGSDHSAIYFNADTGQTTIVASVLPAGSCQIISPTYERCGECTYVPDPDGNGWKSNVTQFRWGRCVNVDMTGSMIQYRGDIRFEDGGAVHELRGQIEFVNGGGVRVGDPRPLDLPDCNSAATALAGGQSVSFSICQGLAWETAVPTTGPPDTEKVCVRLESWYIWGANHFPEYTAFPCRSIAS